MFPSPTFAVDIAPPRSDAEREAAAKRAHAARVRASRDRARVRADANLALVQAMLDLQAEHRPAPGQPMGRPIDLLAVALRGKAIMVALGYAADDAGRAIGARIDPRQQAAPSAIQEAA